MIAWESRRVPPHDEGSAFFEASVCSESAPVKLMNPICLRRDAPLLHIMYLYVCSLFSSIVPPASLEAAAS